MSSKKRARKVVHKAPRKTTRMPWATPKSIREAVQRHYYQEAKHDLERQQLDWLEAAIRKNGFTEDLCNTDTVIPGVETIRTYTNNLPVFNRTKYLNVTARIDFGKPISIRTYGVPVTDLDKLDDWPTLSIAIHQVLRGGGRDAVADQL
jgi:hypothetical protein